MYVVLDADLYASEEICSPLFWMENYKVPHFI